MSFLQLRSPRINNKLANPPVVATNYPFDALAGSYTVTGAAATFRRALAVAATSGSYAVTGAAAATVARRVLPTATASYTVSGVSAATLAQRAALATAGSAAITGSSAFLTRGVTLGATAGSIAVTGQDAVAFFVRVLLTGTGAFAIVGAAADITAGIPPVDTGAVLQRFDAVYNRGIAITPSDTVNFDGTTGFSTKPMTADAVYVGATGVVSVVLETGEPVSFTVPTGYVLPMRCIRINSTLTTASQLVALYLV